MDSKLEKKPSKLNLFIRHFVGFWTVGAYPEPRDPNFWQELLKLIVLAIIIVVPFRLFIAQPYIVDGASMDPTFDTGDYLIVDRLSYHFKTPERGSVLVFKYPKDPKKSFIKRVIGLPGETVSIASGQVTIINSEHPQGFIIDEPYIVLKKSDSSSLVLGEGEYFVMGDNRAASYDSRIWGPVPEANIVGRPIIRFLPPSFFPGDNSPVANTSSTENNTSQ